MTNNENNNDNTVRVYCSSNKSVVQHLANHLEIEGIEHQITGDTSTTILGGYNPTQEICIEVFEKDIEAAKSIIQAYTYEEE